MDELYWVGQVVWVCILACGAYISFTYYDLADAESARTAKPEKRASPAAQADPAHRADSMMAE